MARTRRRHPFVITIASVATVVACGGSTASDLGAGGSSGSSGSGGSGGGTGGSAGVGTGGSSGTGTGGSAGGSCPASFPSHGTPCSLPTGTACNYSQGACCPDWTATCLDGTWQAYASSCNPPPIMCPAAPPVHGTSCLPTDPCGGSYAYCTYGTCSDGSPATIAQCNGGTWDVSYANCLPTCESLDACSCFDRPDCQAVSDGCLCSCDFACPGDPPCACDCGGGTYLGCKSIATP